MPRFDITAAGELNLDLILYGLPQELPPERELLAGGVSLTLGASSAIFAHNAAVLGARVGFITRIGGDPLGKIALERLAAGGVDVSRVRQVNRSTTGLSVILQRNHERTILTYPGTMFEMCFEDLDLDYLSDSRHFHLCSFFLHRALRPRMVELFRRLKASGLTTSLDTNDDPEDRWEGVEELLPYVNVFLPNQREAMKISGASEPEAALEKLAERVEVAAIKLGAQGAMAQRGTERVQRPAVKVEAVDAVGAGDSFDAGFILQYVQGAELQTCLEYANLAGALSATQPGGTGAFLNRAAVKEFLRLHREAAESRPRPAAARGDDD